MRTTLLHVVMVRYTCHAPLTTALLSQRQPSDGLAAQ